MRSAVRSESSSCTLVTMTAEKTHAIRDNLNHKVPSSISSQAPFLVAPGHVRHAAGFDHGRPACLTCKSGRRIRSWC